MFSRLSWCEFLFPLIPAREASHTAYRLQGWDRIGVLGEESCRLTAASLGSDGRARLSMVLSSGPWACQCDHVETHRQRRTLCMLLAALRLAPAEFTDLMHFYLYIDCVLSCS